MCFRVTIREQEPFSRTLFSPPEGKKHICRNLEAPQPHASDKWFSGRLWIRSLTVWHLQSYWAFHQLRLFERLNSEIIARFFTGRTSVKKIEIFHPDSGGWQTDARFLNGKKQGAITFRSCPLRPFHCFFFKASSWVAALKEGPFPVPKRITPAPRFPSWFCR